MKKILLLIACCLLVGAMGAPVAQAAIIEPAGISGSGTYNNLASLIINHVIPAEGTAWTHPACVYWNGITPSFVISYDKLYKIEDIEVQVDNNDNYRIDYSVDGSTWTNLISISSGYGEIGWGMDTMITVSGNPEYISQLDFAPVQAQYLKIYATGGDNSYSVSELVAYGTAAPLPGAVLLFASGLAALVGCGRRLRNS